jgi:hypothetical protein
VEPAIFWTSKLRELLVSANVAGFLVKAEAFGLRAIPLPTMLVATNAIGRFPCVNLIYHVRNLSVDYFPCVDTFLVTSTEDFS